MKFKNNVINKDIAFAVMVAETLFQPESLMMQELREKNDFAFNSGSGIEVYNKILNCKTVAPIFTYRSKLPWSKAMGYSDGKAIHLNLRKLNGLNIPELVGLLCHEYLHLVGFGHGNNFKTKEKCEFSVNYFASSNIGKWI
jgi:hypothetical protein